MHIEKCSESLAKDVLYLSSVSLSLSLLLLWAMQDPKALPGRTPSPRKVRCLVFAGGRAKTAVNGVGFSLYPKLIPMNMENPILPSRLVSLSSLPGCETTVHTHFPFLDGVCSRRCRVTSQVSLPITLQMKQQNSLSLSLSLSDYLCYLSYLYSRLTVAANRPFCHRGHDTQQLNLVIMCG